MPMYVAVPTAKTLLAAVVAPGTVATAFKSALPLYGGPIAGLATGPDVQLEPFHRSTMGASGPMVLPAVKSALKPTAQMSVGEIAANPLFWMRLIAVPGLAPGTWWNCESQVREVASRGAVAGLARDGPGTRGTRARTPSLSNREAPGCAAAAAGTVLKRPLPMAANVSAITMLWARRRLVLTANVTLRDPPARLCHPARTASRTLSPTPTLPRKSGGGHLNSG